MSGGRWHLRDTVGSWSAGTLVTRRGEPGESTTTVSPWARPDVLLDVPNDVLVRRRARGGTPRPPRALQAKQRKRHLVFATSAATERAAKLLPGRAIENAVAEALTAGSVFLHQDGRMVARLDGAVAVVDRTKSVTTGRDAWLVLSVREAA